jgi:hypothetical protein
MVDLPEKNMKLLKKALLLIPLLMVAGVLMWFLYTRFCLPLYAIDGITLTYRHDTYVMEEHGSVTDEENLGDTIGIGVGKERTISDLIWPFWVLEYKGDKEHNSLFLRGLMGSGGKYTRVASE